MYITGVKKTELLGHTVNKKKREVMFIRNSEGKESFLNLGVSGRVMSKYTPKQPKNKQNVEA